MDLEEQGLICVRLEFEPNQHRYVLDGREVPSVTRVLELLDDWSNVPPAILEAARDFGRAVHEACALDVRGQLDWQRLDVALVPYVEAFRAFRRESGVVIVASEMRVGHPEFGFAGTLDLDVILEKHEGQIDIKSGAMPSTVGPQTAAYEVARARTLGKENRRRKRWCLQLDPKFACSYKLHPLTNPSDWSYFQSALNCVRFRRRAA